MLEVSLNGVIRVWQRNMDVYRRFFVNRLITSSLYPLLFLFAMGYGVGGYIGKIEGIPYIKFIAPGVLCSAVMFAASFATTYGTYIKMRFQKTFGAIISTPVSIDETIVGEVLWGATRGLIDGMIIYAVTVAFRLPDTLWSLLIIPFSFVFGIVFSLLGVLVTAIISNIEQFDYYLSCFISLMFLFSGTFFPLSRLPQVFQKFSWILPLTHVIKITRPLFLGEIPPNAIFEFLWLIILIIIVFPIVLILMRKRILEFS